MEMTGARKKNFNFSSQKISKNLDFLSKSEISMFRRGVEHLRRNDRF